MDERATGIFVETFGVVLIGVSEPALLEAAWPRDADRSAAGDAVQRVDDIDVKSRKH